jgi:Tol biopolymer transport system component/DNA-binding winged helix-turn-helix (wHTH) protein
MCVSDAVLAGRAAAGDSSYNRRLAQDLGGTMRAQDDGVYEFGLFRLDVGERLLCREGTAVALEPTQFEVLTALVAEAGHLVTREHLIHAVWKGTYVDEGSLTVTISVLRRKLGDTPSQPKYIETVRKSGYRFVAPVTLRPRMAGGQEASEPPSPHPLPPVAVGRQQAGMHGGLRFAAMAALVTLITIGWFRSFAGVTDPTPAPVPLYPFGGIQDDPSFSPDGEQIAFAWRPPRSDNDDIYVLRLGDLEATRLTNHPGLDKSPAWSPDGRQIAFIRRQGSAGEVLLVSPAGGPEQKVVATEGTSVAWSPDSQTLVFIDRAAGQDGHSIFLVPADGGSKRQLTFPAAESSHGDSSPAISPDGRTLAFVRHLTYDVADIFVQRLDSVEPRRLTFDKRQIRGLAWMPGGQELVFASNRNGRHELWRVKVRGTAQPTAVEGISESRSPAVSSGRSRWRTRLVYQAVTEDYNIWQLNRAPDGAWNASKPSPLAASIRAEQSPRVSPDGRRLSFVSDRSGWFEVWVCAYPEASGCRQLTSFRQGYVGSPNWSPDSQRIAFDARVEGNADIYLVRDDGGQPVRLTHDASVDAKPTWSADNRSIYFRSDRTGAHQIWKMPVSGGAARQVTSNGGFEAFESPDAKSLYYVQGRYKRGLWTLPVDGGGEIRVRGLGSVTASSWAIVDNGILWIDVTASNPPAAIRWFDAATRTVSKIAEIADYVMPSATGFSAARDGSAVMWSQLDRSAHDLMLLERFR